MTQQASDPFQDLIRHGQSLHVAMVTPEAAPFAKSGGLGDVLGSLPQALERLGVRVSLVLPAYRTLLKAGYALEDTGIRVSAPVSNREEEATVLKARTGKNITVYFIRADQYFDRDFLYGPPGGDYPDNAERFVFFSRAALEVLELDPPDILHAHDWQSALAVAFLKAQPQMYLDLSGVRTALTVHNLGYQGVFWSLDWHLLNLDWRFFNLRQLEFHGQINFLKGGLAFADVITTVSPTYAEEVMTPEQGFGLDGLLRERRADLVGILNGVDYDVWNPARDPHLAAGYNTEDLSRKGACKADLQRTFGLPESPNVLVLGMVTRLAAQKGLDLVVDALEDLMGRDLQLVVLGTGDRQYEELMGDLPDQYPGKAATRITFSETLAHKVIAGSDVLLMPSRYEPGGLTQIFALRYGTVPLVRATGGLRDTVQEFDPDTRQGNGFVFGPREAPALLEAVDRAADVFRRRELWAALMRNGMAADFSWDRSTRTYLDLYRRLLAR